MTRWMVAALAAIFAAAGPATATDWPQFQQNAQRQGRTPDGPTAPYQARWIWFGPEKILRNKDSKPEWKDDLEGREGHSLDLPKSVPMTFADGMQPIHKGGVLYALDQEGKAYALNMDDGSAKWTGENPGGSINSPAIAGENLICASVTGKVTALKLADGKPAWTLDTGRTITGSPAVMGDTIYLANHGGWVYSLKSDGTQNWKVRLSAPSIGGIAADEKGCYLGAEDMFFYALNAKDGSTRAKSQLIGQSYRLLWPVVYQDLVLVQTCGAICSGCEGVMDDVLAAGANAKEERENILRWFQGDGSGGRWRFGGENMRHFFVMDRDALKEPYVVANGPIEGCGTPADPPVIDNQGRVLLWWRTKFPTFVRDKTGFGSRFACEISAMDIKTGERVNIDNGKFCNCSNEADNLFGLSVGGDIVYLRQRFRGTHGLDLKKSVDNFIQAESRNRDGGGWPAAVTYVATGSAGVSTPTSAAATRTGPSVAAKMIFFAERYCITAMETGSAKPAGR